VIPANIGTHFAYPETRKIVLPEAENRTIVSSFVWTKHRNVMEGWTDRRTDRILWLLQRSELRAMRCKKRRMKLVDLTKNKQKILRKMFRVIELHYLLIVQFESRITHHVGKLQSDRRVSSELQSLISRYSFTDQKQLRMKLSKHSAIRRLFTTHSVLTVIHSRHQWRNVAVIIDRSLLYSPRHDLLNGLRSLRDLK